MWPIKENHTVDLWYTEGEEYKKVYFDLVYFKYGHKSYEKYNIGFG